MQKHPPHIMTMPLTVSMRMSLVVTMDMQLWMVQIRAPICLMVFRKMIILPKRIARCKRGDGERTYAPIGCM